MGERPAYRLIESERLPSAVGPYEFFYSERFQMAALSCACGCGHRVMLNLLDQHSLELDEGRPTVCPSILVADAPCLSHFWIKRGEVVWAEHWSKARVQRVMDAQLRRHLRPERDSRSIASRFFAWLKRLVKA
jgi:hypothetical protein